MRNEKILWLTTVPASDENFKCQLKSATLEELRKAESIMTGKDITGNITRIDAIAREIRRRERENV